MVSITLKEISVVDRKIIKFKKVWTRKGPHTKPDNLRGGSIVGPPNSETKLPHRMV